jgi:hypothetical protein
MVTAACAARGWFVDTRPVLSDQAVIGVWRGAEGCQFSINADGTFRASSVPASLFDSAQSGTATGTGTWRLAAAINDASGRKTQLALVFETLTNHPVPYSVSLRSDSIGGKVVLFWFVGDPDLGHRFVLSKS